MRRIRALFCLAIPLAVAQCGLPYSYYLAPPGLISTSSGSGPFYVVKTASINSSNAAGFRGFDLYYKLFPTISSVQSGFAGSSYTYENLLSAGFLPVCGPSDTSYSTRSRPLIDVPSTFIDSSFAIEFNFTPTGAVFQYVTDNPSVAVTDPAAYGAPSPEMRRGVTDSDSSSGTYGYAKRFNMKNTAAVANYVIGDADFTDTTVQSAYGTSAQFFIAFYVVSVAYDSTQGYYYSYPIYLGYVGVTNS